MAPSVRTRSSGAGSLRVLLLLLAVLVLGGILRARDAETREDAASAGVECPSESPRCRHAAPGPFAPQGPTVVPASDVCLAAGYLCAGLPGTGELRIARWNLDQGRLHIRVPTPPGLGAADARAVQEAAARGLRAWHGRPFPMRVDLSDRPGAHDFVVTWAARLGDRRLGRASTRWTLQGGRADLEVAELALATRDPDDPRRPLTPSRIELAAAHEMGHALGLPHSDEPRDVMYPQNTATRPTARDYITVSALYELENGAVVREMR